VASDLDQAHLNHAHALAARYPNVELIRDDIVDSKLPAHSFGLALCSEVVEHIPGTASFAHRLPRRDDCP
jgi:2-polyprenyl-3-methyl-5-hydroxy-6-metoxy-1,4-benzoquinol methylase